MPLTTEADELLNELTNEMAEEVPQPTFMVGHAVEWRGGSADWSGAIETDCSVCRFEGIARVLSVQRDGSVTLDGSDRERYVLPSCIRYLRRLTDRELEQHQRATAMLEQEPIQQRIEGIPTPPAGWMEPRRPLLVVGDTVQWTGPRIEGWSFDGTATVDRLDRDSIHLRLHDGASSSWMVREPHYLHLTAVLQASPTGRLRSRRPRPEWAPMTSDLPAVGTIVKTTSGLRDWPGLDQVGEVVGHDSNMYVAIQFTVPGSAVAFLSDGRRMINSDWYAWSDVYTYFIQYMGGEPPAAATGVRKEKVLPTLFTLTDTPRHFGIEIEAYHPSARYGEFNRIAEMMESIGIACADEEYNHQERNYWKVVSDGSLGRHGFELVSPILQGADGLESVRAVMRQLRNNGATVNATCGLHVHWDAGHTDEESRLQIARSYYTVLPQFKQLFPQSRLNNQYSGSVAPSRVENRRFDRYQAVNTEPAFSRHGTVEFRQHQGTLMGDKAVAWILFTHQFMTTRRTDNDKVDQLLVPGPFKGAITTYEYKAVDTLRQRLQLDPIEHLNI